MKKYIDKYKRKLIVLFYTGASDGLYSLLRDVKRNSRLIKIRQTKEIYDLTTMD